MKLSFISFYIFFKIYLLSASTPYFGISNDCIELLKIEKYPSDCCEFYPRLEVTENIDQQCLHECPSNERVKYNCCYRSCLFAKSGIYNNDEFIIDNLKTFYNHNDGNEWEKILNESLRKCEEEILKSSKITEDSCIPNYIHEIIACSFKENFLNCPNFSNDKLCNEMINLTTKCDECEELFEDNIHPTECCNLPSREILETHKQKCKLFCKNDDSKLQAGCCEIDCIYSVTGVLKNGNLVKDAVIELYENFLQKNGGGKFDKWINIIENSVEKCAKAVQKTTDALVCNIPEHFMDFLDCIDSHNFLNCPNYKNTKACNKTKEIFEKEICGKKFNEIFVVSHKIWNKKD